MHPDSHSIFLKSSEGQTSAGVRIRTEKRFSPGKDHGILCRQCGHIITNPESIISVNGRHQHTFINPAGITYDIGCFSSADGCVAYGVPTLEHTWFEGFSWCFSLCSRCFAHLGWLYENGEERFFGLITESLVDTTTTH